MRQKSSTRAFTLIELLVVMSIISILASMILPALGKAKEKALGIACVNNVRQLGLSMQMFGDDNQDNLPLAHGEVPWTSVNPEPWTKPLKDYYSNVNVLSCPSLSRKYNQAKLSYFMGARQAYIDAGGNPAKVQLGHIRFPSSYVLSGDSNYPAQATDADQVNYTNDTLFAEENLPSPVHNSRMNVLFGDLHVKNYKSFNAGDLTFSYYVEGVPFY
jgi:prepilin-type N-terminal cleavage/methylation domain-containing protein/prepilin-type processing-associated H-X9-DG protein